MNKMQLVALLGGVSGYDADLDMVILQALGLPAEKLRRRYALFDRSTSRWVAMPMPTTFLGDAVRLVDARRLEWRLKGGRGARSGVLASIEGRGEWGGATAAVALTRALVAHSVANDWEGG